MPSQVRLNYLVKNSSNEYPRELLLDMQGNQCQDHFPLWEANVDYRLLHWLEEPKKVRTLQQQAASFLKALDRSYLD